MRSDLTLRNQRIMESIKQANKIAFEQMQIKAGKYRDKKSKEEIEEEENPEPDDGSIIDLFNTNVFDPANSVQSSNTTTQNNTTPQNNNVTEDPEEDPEEEEAIITSSTASTPEEEEEEVIVDDRN